jgi:hypothetical protein
VCNEKQILDIVQDLAGGKPCQIWASHNLAWDLGLPITSSFPSLRLLQAFVLCVGHPPFLVTIFKEGTDPIKFEEYSRNTTRILHWCLLDYCHLNFVLLPICVPADQFNKEVLEQRLRENSMLVGRFFRKPMNLNEKMCKELTAVTEAMMGATFVPSLLETPEPEDVS